MDINHGIMNIGNEQLPKNDNSHKTLNYTAGSLSSPHRHPSSWPSHEILILFFISDGEFHYQCMIPNRLDQLEHYHPHIDIFTAQHSKLFSKASFITQTPHWIIHKMYILVPIIVFISIGEFHYQCPPPTTTTWTPHTANKCALADSAVTYNALHWFLHYASTHQKYCTVMIFKCLQWIENHCTVQNSAVFCTLHWLTKLFIQYLQCTILNSFITHFLTRGAQKTIAHDSNLQCTVL